MTVAELIEALQNMPSDAEVFTYQTGDDTPEKEVGDAYLCYTGCPEEPYRVWGEFYGDVTEYIPAGLTKIVVI